MAKLVYTDQGEELEFLLDGSRSSYTIGRNPMCDLRINNPSISRKHAELRLDAATGRYSLYDLNSSNGTYVNGKRESSAQLSHGDELLCGEFKLLFVEDEQAVAPSPTSGHAAELDDEVVEAEVAPERPWTGDEPPVAELKPAEPALDPPQTEMDRPAANDDSELDGLRAELESVRASLANETARADEAAAEAAQLRTAIDELTARNAELQHAIDDLGGEMRALLEANEELLDRVSAAE